MASVSATTLAALAVMIVPAPVAAQPASGGGGGTRSAEAMAVRATQPPAIDGRDADAVWATAPSFSEFREFEPDPNGDPRFATEFKVAYDDRNLYVFVRAHDPHPDSIMRALTRRDVRGPSDQIKVIVDSYNDRRSGFQFAVNPDGVKRDYTIYNDSDEDESWNGVWDVATTVDSLGWTAEFRIPLSQLRYNGSSQHTFGFGIWRDIERYKERVSWPVYSITRPGLASQLGQLDGIRDIAAPGQLEITPYTVAKNVSRAEPGGAFGRDQQWTVGGDLKYGITPNVTLDVTVNPDFGQVEADPAILNLTALETFLGERRPFFVEGTGLYRFALNCYIVVDCGSNEGLFYSRRIGRAPSLLNTYGDASTPTATPIAAAAKLTGRTPGGLSFGVLDAVTQHVDGADDRTVEPRSNYAVLRAQQDLRDGEAGIGWIATAINRSLDEWSRPYLHESAYVTGVSARNRFGGGNWEIAGSAVVSRIAGSEEAIARTQQNGVHFFQQPDDDLEFDPTRTSLSGSALHLKFGKYGGGITRFETSLVRQSAGFDVNDIGFLRRADILDWSTWAALNFMTPTRAYRWLRINGNHWETWNTSGLRLENAVNFNAHLGLHNNWNLHAGATFGGLTASFCDRCTRGGPALRKSRNVYPWFGVNGDNRLALVPGMWVNLGFFDDGQSHFVSLSPYLDIRVSTRLQASVSADFRTSEDHTQWFGNFEDQQAGVTRYSFAHLDQKTLSMSVRGSYAATPDLTLELYAQPFVSRGTYSDFRELSATPDAADYTARFTPFTPPASADTAFRFTRLRTNAVLRWEYRPGSTLFLVWAHGREAFVDEAGDRPWRREYRELLELHPDNTFLIKVAYWLSR